MNDKPNNGLNDQTRGIFFDLYGTLLVFNDFDHANSVWVKSFYDMIGEENSIDHDQVKEICTDILESKINRDSADCLTTYETKIKNSFDKNGIKFSLEKIKIIADRTAEMWQQNVQLADDALPVLNELKKKKKLALITNFDHSPHIRKILNRTKIDVYFDTIVISDEAGCLKPESEIFELALTQTGLKPHEVVYIGDNIKDDVLGAFSAGITPILISRNSKSHYSNDFCFQSSIQILTIGSLSELIDLFK